MGKRQGAATDAAFAWSGSARHMQPRWKHRGGPRQLPATPHLLLIPVACLVWHLRDVGCGPAHMMVACGMLALCVALHIGDCEPAVHFALPDMHMPFMRHACLLALHTPPALAVSQQLLLGHSDGRSVHGACMHASICPECLVPLTSNRSGICMGKLAQAAKCFHSRRAPQHACMHACSLAGGGGDAGGGALDSTHCDVLVSMTHGS